MTETRFDTFTKGPWRLLDSGPIVVGANGIMVAAATRRGDAGWADAWLIHAAPDLLEELREIHETDYHLTNECRPDCTVARAIKKATGAQS